MEKLEVEGSFSVAEGGSTDPKRKADHSSARTVLTEEESEGLKGVENERQGMEVDDVIPETQPSSNETDGGFIMCQVEEQQAARVEVQRPKRRMTRVESAETQDYVRERLAHGEINQEEADEIGFVPSASSELRGAFYWCDNRCSDEALRFLQIASMVIEDGGEARTINLRKRCCNEKLVQQGKQSLKSMEWRWSCGKEGSSWHMEDLRNRTISARNVGVFHSQKGRGKQDTGGCRSGKNKKEYRVSGNKNLPSKKFWSKSKEMRIQIAMPK